MRKIYLLPNFVTTANMFCGFYSVVASTQSDYKTAAWAILAAAVFDLLDGRIARLARATSQFGIEYDSLSDLMSFGMAPAFLAYEWVLKPYGRLGWAIAFLFLACGALRLARFNSNVHSVPKGTFQGLPIPMAAGELATFAIFCDALNFENGVLVLIMTAVLSILMVSTLPFPSFKEFNWRSRASFRILLAGVFSLLFIVVNPEMNLFLVLSAYILLSIGWFIYSLLSKKKIADVHAQAQSTTAGDSH